MGDLAKLGQHLTFLPLSISIFMQISPDSNLLTNYRYTGGFPADALVKHQRNVRNHLATLNWPWCVCRGLGVEVAGVVKAGLEEDPAGPPQLLHEAPLPPPLLARPRRRAPAGRPQPRGRGAADHGVHAGRCPCSCHHLVLTPHSLTFTSCNNVNLNIPSSVTVSILSLLKQANFKRFP